MSFTDLFDAPEDEKQAYKPLPTRQYQVEIESAVMEENAQWGPKLCYTLRIVEESEFKNRKIWVNRKIAANTMFKIRDDLNNLGFEKVSSKNVNSVLEQLPGKVVNISLGYQPNKTNPAKPWQNVEFISGGDESLPSGERPMGFDDTDIPF